MPDLVNFEIVRNAGTTNLNMPTWTISGRVVDSKTQQTVLRDFTGANAVSFPQILSQLTNAQQDALVERIIVDLLYLRYGIG